MFLVLTRSSRPVDELSFLARRIPTIETPYIEKRSEENKNKIKLSHAHLSRLLICQIPTSFFFILILFYFIIIIIIIWRHSSYCLIRVCFYPKNFYFFLAHFIFNELSSIHFLTSEIFVNISSLKSLMTYHPENRQIFRLYQNSTKLFWVTRFLETNLTDQSVSSSEI